MIEYFDNGFSITMTKEQALSCSHHGSCDDDVRQLSVLPKINRQFKKIPAQDIVYELKEYGAWNEEELSDHDQNIQRILWIAANNIAERQR